MRTELQRFGALLRKEFIEHRNLFVVTPAVFSLLMLLIGYLIVLALPESSERVLLEQASGLLLDLPLRSAAIFPVLLSAPFAPALFLTSIIYLTVCLYQDRKDRSFLFWQSMPVSDWQAVLARVVTTVFVIPAIAAAFLLICLLALALWLQFAASRFDLPFAFGKTLLLALDGTVLFYCFAWLHGLLFMPIIGWFLLFSAWSRRVPFLWAVGVLCILALLEAWLLDSIYFVYWMNWSARELVLGYPDIFSTLFSYDMLIALTLGGVLLWGATLMRRFND
ncbi:MAG: hypothetical protein OXI13_04260 [Gammaproteobacteria bacterium]|nr:hypothetical protein [Gammaproteobacteria bacterium]